MGHVFWQHPVAPDIRAQFYAGDVLTGVEISSSSLFDWGGTANYTLEITCPKSTLASGHKSTRAYTGLTYTLRVAAVGGVYPYLYELQNEPSGMTIGAFTGVITWTNPTATATPSVRVTDTKGTSVSESWTITVGTSGWRFIAGTGDDAIGDGSLGNPWRTLFQATSAGAATDVVCARTGTYDTSLFTVQSAGGQGNYVEIPATDPGIFVAYPGETPVLDWGTAGVASSFIQLNSAINYWEGWDFRDAYHIGFLVTRGSARGAYFCGNTFRDIGPAIGGANSAWVSYDRSSADMTYGDVFVDNTFAPTNSPNTCMYKFYDTEQCLVARNTFSGCVGTQDAVIAFKGGCDHYTFRGNTGTATCSDTWIGGNGANSDPPLFVKTSGESCFNLYLGTGKAWNIPDGGHWTVEDGGVQYVYRNTGTQAQWEARDVDDANDGPVTFFRNVIVNSLTPPITKTSCAFLANVIETENLTGVPADGILTAGGLLQGSYRTTYLYLRGHEVP